MAEFILKFLVRESGRSDDFYIESAAVSDEEYGNPIYPPAKRCMNAHGIPYDSSKTARTVTKSDYDRFDMIICMDRSNLRWLSRIIGEDSQNKVRLMMPDGRDVADPWYTGDFEKTYQDLTAGCKALLNECD